MNAKIDLTIALIASVVGCGCGASSASTEPQPTSNSGGAQGPAQSRNDPALTSGMALANLVRAEYTQLRTDHEAAWQERIQNASGPDLTSVEMRYPTVSADFSARADQAWQSMNTAVGYLRQNQVEQFRHFINQARAQVAVLRQMVEQVQGELRQMRGPASPPPPTAQPAAEPAPPPADEGEAQADNPAQSSPPVGTE